MEVGHFIWRQHTWQARAGTCSSRWVKPVWHLCCSTVMQSIHFAPAAAECCTRPDFRLVIQRRMLSDALDLAQILLTTSLLVEDRGCIRADSIFSTALILRLQQCHATPAQCLACTLQSGCVF